MPDFKETCSIWSNPLARAVGELSRLFPFVSAAYLEQAELDVRVHSRLQRVTEPRRSAGIVLRVFDGVKFVEEAVDAGAGEKGLFAAKQRLADAADRPSGPGVAVGSGVPAVRKTSFAIDPEFVPLDEKLDRCRELERRLAATDPRIVNAQASYSEIAERTFFLASDGRQLAQEVFRIRLTGVAFAQKDGLTQMEYRTRGGTGGFELARLSDEEVAAAGETAVRLLDAAKVDPGYYDCICSPELAGLIAHEAFGHGVEADMFLKGRARAAQYVGRKVGSEVVDLIDDPTYPGAYGSYFFDDEGVEATPTYILRRGVFERPLTDQNAARRLDIAPTANGRRQDFQRKVYPRMSNTFFGTGKDTLEGMLADVDHGVMLVRGYSGMEDPKDWGIQVIAHYGAEIKGGKLTGRLFAPIGVTGYVPDLLASVTMAGREIQTDTGFCGKGHKEFVPVSTGGPYIRLKARLG